MWWLGLASVDISCLSSSCDVSAEMLRTPVTSGHFVFDLNLNIKFK